MTEVTGLIRPDWALPQQVRAYVTTRQGGCSQPPRASFNLGEHTGDDPQAVAANRTLLRQALAADSGISGLAVQWLRQVHGTALFQAGATPVLPPPTADAAWTDRAGLALGVLTADCLPVLFCSAEGEEIAVAHAGWRGLLGGVLETTVRGFRVPPQHIRAWLGPAIGPCHFEVGQEVLDAFAGAATAAEHDATLAAFRPGGVAGKWLADLYALAHIRLRRAGLVQVSGSPLCTICNHDRFYSYRLQPVTGRFATLIVKTA